MPRWLGVRLRSFHWFWFIIMVIVVLYPAGRILSRMGFSPLWSVLLFFPVLNLVAMWIPGLKSGSKPGVTLSGTQH
ncbi:MAG: hypothetical protein KGL35_12970 [Bradyrhizobium sp.]|nr:hypothetical protein [Bradyrhizobium sp.]